MRGKKRPYFIDERGAEMANNYWEKETPEAATTTKNILRYFSEAGKLQISMPSWKNEAGEEKTGKTVTLDITALKASPDALELVKRAVIGSA